MCGRFAFFSSKDTLIDAFGDIPGLEFSPRYNIAPSQDIAVVVSTDEQRAAEWRSLAGRRTDGQTNGPPAS